MIAEEGDSPFFEKTTTTFEQLFFHAALLSYHAQLQIRNVELSQLLIDRSPASVQGLKVRILAILQIGIGRSNGHKPC